MTALSQVINDCRTDYLSAGRPQELNRLNANITDSATTLTCTYGLDGLTSGSRISIDLEDMHVWTIDVAAKQADGIERGQFGTTGAAHTSGDLIRVNPLYSDGQILRAINRTVDDLDGEGLFQIAAVELTADTSVTGYDLAPTNFIDVHEVWTRSTSTGTKTWLPVENYDVMHSAETDVFASGVALQIWEPIYNGTQLRVIYKQKLGATALAALADVVETVTGLESSTMDILSIGAALHLTSGKEIDRSETNSQRGSRRAAEVPSGAWTDSTRNLRRLYKDRVATERKRLELLYPTRMKNRSY